MHKKPLGSSFKMDTPKNKCTVTIHKTKDDTQASTITIPLQQRLPKSRYSKKYGVCSAYNTLDNLRYIPEGSQPKYPRE